MELRERIAQVQSALKVDSRAAISIMAESVLGYFDSRAILESATRLGPLLALSEREGSSTSSHEAEAVAASKRAWAMHKNPKVSLAQKLKAHDDAEEAHMHVGMRKELAGHSPDEHYGHADKHTAARKELGSADEELSEPQKARSDAERMAFVAQQRAAKLQQKIAAKRTAKMMESIGLDEGVMDLVHKAPSHVQDASNNALKASIRAKKSGKPEDHETAKTAHRIALSAAAAEGHHELASVHKDLHGKHGEASAPSKVA